ARTAPGERAREKQKTPGKERKEPRAPAPATILVSLPADAKLFVDDAATTSTSTSRTFVTPALENGKTYGYTLKAEVVRDGKVVSTVNRTKFAPASPARSTSSSRPLPPSNGTKTLMGQGENRMVLPIFFARPSLSAEMKNEERRTKNEK